MKLNIQAQKTIASEDLVSSKMGMAVESSDFFNYVLRDKIYKDKILAPIRELITNAIDEHRKHSIDKNVEVKLSTINGSWLWSVRDYANGLNEDHIRNIFAMYGRSTKQDDNTQVGMYGVGSKSPLAYGDSFYVTSYHQGVKTSYVCSLGRGDNGVSVGEIFKVGEEPTTEQGIEVSLDVRNSDLFTFSNKTINFVEFFSPSAKLIFDNQHGKNSTEPLTPLNTKTVDGFVFNAYATQPFHRYDQTTYWVRMGGVIYPHTHSNSKVRGFSNNVVVDIPIGMLSIPISRESIETTPLNDKVFDKIEEAIDKIIADEISVLTPPKFGELVTGKTTSTNFSGGWFRHNFKTCFPSTHISYYHVGKIWNDPYAYGSAVCKGSTKYIVYILPHIDNLNNWHKRLISALKIVKGDDYDGYIWIRKNHYEKMMETLDSTIDISDCSFVDVKSLKLPKFVKTANTDPEKYVVHTGNGYRNGNSYTAQEFDEKIRKSYFNGDELEDDWHQEVEDIHLLNRRTIGDTKRYGTRSSFPTANSKKMIENLKELGWLTPECKEYTDIKEKFDKIYRNERLVSNAVYSLNDIYYGSAISARLKKIIKNSPEKIIKLKSVNDTIKAENSIRGRILQSISSYDQKITRKDLRKILTMKD